MSRILDETVSSKLKTAFEALVNPVRLIFFTQENACPNCLDEGNLLREISELSSKITLEVYDFVLNSDQVLSYKINKIPATAIVGKRDFGIRFYGLTLGYELTSLIEAIIMVSTEQTGLDPRLEIPVKTIADSVHLQVMTTLTCPHCPNMVRIAHQFAFLNDKISADMVEMTEFPHLAQRYNVTSTPKTIINESQSFVGALSSEAVYLEIMKAVNPQKFREIEEELAGTQAPKTGSFKEMHEYQVAIVGGGPAAMSAAIYAARKGSEVILIAKKIGGQINYTASIDNYLGLPETSGTDMAQAFLAHIEKFKIAKIFGLNVSKIEQTQSGFELLMEDNQRIKAKSVIYCAGKEYRKLGVAGEERFIGNGVGFCATCDAPLYAGKRVAVVGGGNSAFTSARDLLNYASEINIIHRENEFTADATLIQQVRQSSKVKFHKPFEVEEFLGTDKLLGLRLESINKKERYDISVDGVFLEIGLTPNSKPLASLINLTPQGEVPVNRDQSTQIKGLFAAGDVTDTEEKQISNRDWTRCRSGVICLQISN